MILSEQHPFCFESNVPNESNMWIIQMNDIKEQVCSCQVVVVVHAKVCSSEAESEDPGIKSRYRLLRRWQPLSENDLLPVDRSCPNRGLNPNFYKQVKMVEWYKCLRPVHERIRAQTGSLTKLSTLKRLIYISTFWGFLHLRSYLMKIYKYSISRQTFRK